MADFFCHRDHYLRRLPVGKMQSFGCWEDARPVGAIVYSRGACKDLAARFGFDQTEAVEQTRVAFGRHRAPITRFVAVALRQLKAANPRLQVVISFSDPAQSHNGHTHDGTIYRAGNWMFLGMTHAESMIRIGGALRHRRTITSKFRTRAVSWLREHVDDAAERVTVPPKYRFVMPLTDEARARLRAHVQSYPKAVVVRDRSVDSAHAGRRLGVCLLAPAATSTREEAGAIPDPVAPRAHEAAHV